MNKSIHMVGDDAVLRAIESCGLPVLPAKQQLLARIFMKQEATRAFSRRRIIDECRHVHRKHGFPNSFLTNCYESSLTTVTTEEVLAAAIRKEISFAPPTTAPAKKVALIGNDFVRDQTLATELAARISSNYDVTVSVSGICADDIDADSTFCLYPPAVTGLAAERISACIQKAGVNDCWQILYADEVANWVFHPMTRGIILAGLSSGAAFGPLLERLKVDPIPLVYLGFESGGSPGLEPASARRLAQLMYTK